MVMYRRNIVAGSRYFFTVTLLDRASRLLVERIEELRAAFRLIHTRRPFTIDAIVVLPDHLHCVWTLPEGDADYALRWREIKSHFSRRIPAEEQRSPGRINKGERGIWQRRYWEHTLRDEEDAERHIDYIHYNPVKHGHVARVSDWPFSSFHRFMRHGIYPPYWGGADVSMEGDFGE